MSSTTPLRGFLVGVTADRRASEQATMLARLGARVLRAPVIRTSPLEDEGPLRASTEALIAQPPHILVANTGLGMRSWWDLAASWGLDHQLRQALSATCVVARGPKAAAAVGVAGLTVRWAAPTEQLTSVEERLREERLAGKRIALQLHGCGHLQLADRLRRSGAEVIELPVYRWELPEDQGTVLRLIDLVCRNSVDAVTFTSAPAVGNLFSLARRAGREAELLEAFNGPVLAACVGPVCAAAAREVGVEQPAHPYQWRLGPLVRLVAERLQARRRTFLAGPHQLGLQGRTVFVDGRPSDLSQRELAVLHELLCRSGAVVAKATLLRRVWGATRPDPSVVDTTVGRLRAKLGPAGRSIQTVPRRGYRLVAKVPEG